MADNKEKNPGRIAKFFRDYKSELKKITWCPFKSVKSSTALVVGLVAVFAVVIGLIDYGANTGIVEFGKLF